MDDQLAGIVDVSQYDSEKLFKIFNYFGGMFNVKMTNLINILCLSVFFDS